MSRIRNLQIVALAGALALGFTVARAAAEKRELLSSHKTVARFDGLQKTRCRGLTSLCPDRCGHSGSLAVFTILRYRAYEKTGEYGDPEQKQFHVLVEDNMGDEKIPAAIRDAIKALKPGDIVELDWNHDYVTNNNGSYPERPIVRIEKTKEPPQPVPPPKPAGPAAPRARTAR